MKTTARAVVIGGGVVGVSTLYHLAKMGWSTVCTRSEGPTRLFAPLHFLRKMERRMTDAPAPKNRHLEAVRCAQLIPFYRDEAFFFAS
jgi:hypothetical protein